MPTRTILMVTTWVMCVIRTTTMTECLTWLTSALKQSFRTEVPAKATRRRFSARYKLRILEQADGCEESGGVGALLRREGLYWSNLQTWRRQREHGTLQALTPRKRGRKAKPVNPLDHQLRQVEAENRKLKRKLEKFEAMLDLQKKVSQLLGISLASSEENGDES